MAQARSNWWTQPAFTSPSRVGVPYYDWETAIRHMNWHPGEHVTLIGPTGRGKTEVEIQLMLERNWTVFLSTKRKDATQQELVRRRYRIIRDPLELNPEVDSHFLFRPPFPDTSAQELKALHRSVYSRMLMRLRNQMGWTIGADEVHYLSHFLGLNDELELLWLQGRSEATTMIANTQRPRHIPLVAYSQATHLFFWSSPDLSDVRRIGEMTPLPIKEIIAILESQEEHDVLYCNTRSSELFITNTRW